jgi:hypothetical protein
MRRLAIAAVMFALLPAPVYAQQRGAPTARTDEEKKQDAETYKAYQDTLKRMDVAAPAASSDPWQDVRPAPATTATSKRQ